MNPLLANIPIIAVHFFERKRWFKVKEQSHNEAPKNRPHPISGVKTPFSLPPAELRSFVLFFETEVSHCRHGCPRTFQQEIYSSSNPNWVLFSPFTIHYANLFCIYEEKVMWLVALKLALCGFLPSVIPYVLCPCSPRHWAFLLFPRYTQNTSFFPDV